MPALERQTSLGSVALLASIEGEEKKVLAEMQALLKLDAPTENDSRNYRRLKKRHNELRVRRHARALLLRRRLLPLLRRLMLLLCLVLLLGVCELVAQRAGLQQEVEEEVTARERGSWWRPRRWVCWSGTEWLRRATRLTGSPTA